MRPRQHHNPKKRLRPIADVDKNRLIAIAQSARYVGNPDHKRNPGDFGLDPPSRPRLSKSLCDAANIFAQAEAQELLREGIQGGVVSVQEEQGWPRIVWAVHNHITVLEARLDNAAQGTYHGYPLEPDDPFVPAVLDRWEAT